MLRSAHLRNNVASGAAASSATEKSHASLGLHRAAGTGNVAHVLFALENGQSANSQLHGITPLHVAACLGDITVLQLLLFFGADVNLPRVRSRSVGGPGVEGSTALHFAAANGHHGVLCFLLEHGARPALLDKDGQTPESLAVANRHAACAAALQQWIDAHGLEGYTDPESIKELGLAPPWSEYSTSTGQEEDTDTPLPLSPFLRNPPYPATRLPSKPALSVRTDVTPADGTASAHSRHVSPNPFTATESKRRMSLPFLIEKAAHPASSLRALWPQASQTGARDDEQEVSSANALRIPRISSRTGLTGLLKRATGSGAARPLDDAGARAVLTEEALPDSGREITSRFSSVLSSANLLSLVHRRSQENMSEPSEASASLSASPVSDTTSGSRPHARATRGYAAGSAVFMLNPTVTPPPLPLASTSTPANKMRVHLVADGLPCGASANARLRRNSASNTQDTQMLAATTRARASSEVQAPARDTLESEQRVPLAEPHSSLAELLAHYDTEAKEAPL